MWKHSARSARKVKTAILLGIVSVASGCTSLQLHNPQLDAASTAVKKDWDAAGLNATIDSERQNLNKLLAAEQSAIERRFDAQLRFSLDRLLFENDFQITYEDLFSEQVKQLVGSTDKLEEYGNNLTDNEDARRSNLESLADSIETIAQVAADLDEISCTVVQDKKQMEKVITDISKLPSSRRAGVTESLTRIREICANLLELDKQYEELLGSTEGRLKEAVDSKNTLMQSVNELKLKAKRLRNEYNKQLKEYNDLIKKKESGSNKQKLQELSAKLKMTIEDLNAIPDGFGEKVVAESRIEQLDDAIRILAGDTSNSEIASKSLKEGLAQLSLISSLKDDIDAAIAASKKPLATPLLISREHHKLKSTAAETRVKSKEAEVRLASQLVDALSAQVEVLLSSGRHYAVFREQAEQQNLNINAPTVQVIAAAKQNRKQDINTRFHLYSAIVYLMDAIGRVDLQSYQIEQNLIANAHESALLQGDIAVKMWENLISQSISQLAQYHSGGVKPEQIAEYLQSLGIVWIGNGVN